jgi:hypothetical protein
MQTQAADCAHLLTNITNTDQQEDYCTYPVVANPLLELFTDEDLVPTPINGEEEEDEEEEKEKEETEAEAEPLPTEIRK